MSWQCTEGPYGRYPGEDGYEEDLERYAYERVNNTIRTGSSEESNIVRHIKKASRNYKVPWICNALGLAEYMGTFYACRLPRCYRTFTVNELTKVVEVEGKKNLYILDNGMESVEVSRDDSSEGYNAITIDVTCKSERAEAIVDKIQNHTIFLIVFAKEEPTKDQQPFCSVYTCKY